MISDFVKGKKKFDYPPNIQKGINLHRAIDTYTDEHKATHQAKQIFKNAYRLYSAPIVDILFDHFLANDLTEFKETSLEKFCQTVYIVLLKNESALPHNFKIIVPSMIQHNWLFNYSTVVGIEKSLQGLQRRAAYMPDATIAMYLFNKNYELLQECFKQLWQDLKLFSKQQYDLISPST